MVSESPGRNASERIGGPEILKPWRPSLTVERRRQHGPSHLADAAGHPRGGIATARGPRHLQRLEKPSPPHPENGRTLTHLSTTSLGGAPTATREQAGSVYRPTA